MSSFVLLLSCLTLKLLLKGLSFRLPFDEAQLEIPDEDKTNPFEDQPQGFINNNPPKNNPIISGKKEGGGGGGGAQRGGRRQQSGGGKGNGRRAQQQKKSQGGRAGGNQGGQKRQKNGKGKFSLPRQGGQLYQTLSMIKASFSIDIFPLATQIKYFLFTFISWFRLMETFLVNLFFLLLIKVALCTGGGGRCPGGNMESCIDACVPLSTQAYASCVRVCGKRC